MGGTIERLRKELVRANDLVNVSKKPQLTAEELEEMHPTAAMTSKFLKSGLTLTEVYSLYFDQVGELEVLKQENIRLNQSMDSIVEDLTEKAPILKKQRLDYERAIKAVQQLTA